MSIADAIKRYRSNQGLTQLDLAMKINRTVRCVQRYEKGDTMPSVKIINEIFNIKLEDVISNELVDKRGI